MLSVGFIGGGRVTRILLGGWAHAALLPPVVVNEPDDAAFGALAAWVGPDARGSVEMACRCDVVVLALHPPQLAAALEQVGRALQDNAVLLSLAPKITLADMRAASGTGRVARMIPNAPSIIGRGFNPVVFASGVPEQTRTAVRELFAPLGEVVDVPEPDLEAYAIVSAMGPTYFWPQFQALREVACTCGLGQEDATRAVSAMLSGAIATLLEADLSPAAVMDLVPVKPLAQQEPGIVAAFHTVLPTLHGKISPTATAGATH